MAINKDDFILKACSITKTFRQGARDITVLNNLDLDIQPKSALCIMGPSGAGKSTFLQILGLLDNPSSGRIFYKGENLSQADEEKKAEFRRNKLGFVFQFHYLLSEFNALENILIAGQIGGKNMKESTKKAHHLMKSLSIDHCLKQFPNELSGGERQRVAMARALMNEPEILLVDEPTGNLDTKNSIKILDMLFELRAELGITLVAVSHDAHFSKYFPTVLNMRDGQWSQSC